MGTKAERRAARDRVGAYHEARLAELVEHIAAAVDRVLDESAQCGRARCLISPTRFPT